MANGKRFRHDGASAASRSLPLGTVAKVKYLETGQTTTVTIQDYGPSCRGARSTSAEPPRTEPGSPRMPDLRGCRRPRPSCRSGTAPSKQERAPPNPDRKLRDKLEGRPNENGQREREQSSHRRNRSVDGYNLRLHTVLPGVSWSMKRSEWLSCSMGMISGRQGPASWLLFRNTKSPRDCFPMPWMQSWPTTSLPRAT